MKIRFLTENGTLYEINKTQMTWAKISTTDRSGPTRHDSGRLIMWPNIVMSEQALLQDDDVAPGCSTHFVHTSRVVAIEEQLDLPMEPA